MAKQFQRMVFDPDSNNPYTADRGTEVFSSSGFYKPPDMTDAVATAIVTAAGAAATGSTPPCSDSSSFTPRKLRFIRTGNGQQNTVSVPINSRANIEAAAIAIRTQLNGMSDDFSVVCVQLIGEKWDNVYEELRTSTDALAPGEDSRPADTNAQQLVYTGTWSYQIDGPGAQTRVLPFKINTDVAGSPPTIYTAPWQACVPDQRREVQVTCRGRQTVTHRRYIVDSIVNKQTGVDQDGNPTYAYPQNRAQSAEIPTPAGVAQDIFSCGTIIANLNSTVCLAYRGESNSRYDRLMP